MSLLSVTLSVRQSMCLSITHSVSQSVSLSVRVWFCVKTLAHDIKISHYLVGTSF